MEIPPLTEREDIIITKDVLGLTIAPGSLDTGFVLVLLQVLRKPCCVLYASQVCAQWSEAEFLFIQNKTLRNKVCILCTSRFIHEFWIETGFVLQFCIIL